MKQFFSQTFRFSFRKPLDGFPINTRVLHRFKVNHRLCNVSKRMTSDLSTSRSAVYGWLDGCLFMYINLSQLGKIGV